MAERTGPTRLDASFARARALIERGKQRQALDELWKAEALVRGNPEGIRELSNFASAFEQQVAPRQKPYLEELARTLRHDAETASRPRTTTTAAVADPRDPIKVVLWTFLALGGGGAVIGGIIGFVLGSSSCSSEDMICFSRGDTTIAGVIIFGLAGVGIALVGLLAWLLVRVAARHGSRADS
jgi:hypothetical protein